MIEIAEQGAIYFVWWDDTWEQKYKEKEKKKEKTTQTDLNPMCKNKLKNKSQRYNISVHGYEEKMADKRQDAPKNLEEKQS